MSPAADAPLPATVVAYYRAVESTLLEHLRNRPVHGFGPPHETGPTDETGRGGQGTESDPVDLHIADLADLDEAIRSGITSFRLPGLTRPSFVSLHIRAGTGTGMDTVATAALALATAMTRDGHAATAVTDGAEGLYLIGFPVGPVDLSAVAPSYAAVLAGQAPEIATTDPADSDGRALIEPLPNARSRSIPSPYSLLALPGGPAGSFAVAAPLTMDEVAAASAGMPLEIGPVDIVDRLRLYGDLAAALSQVSSLPA